MSSLIDDAGVWRLQATGGTAKLVSEGGVWRLKAASVAPTLEDVAVAALLDHAYPLANAGDPTADAGAAAAIPLTVQGTVSSFAPTLTGSQGYYDQLDQASPSNRLKLTGINLDRASDFWVELVLTVPFTPTGAGGYGYHAILETASDVWALVFDENAGYMLLVDSMPSPIVHCVDIDTAALPDPMAVFVAWDSAAGRFNLYVRKDGQAEFAYQSGVLSPPGYPASNLYIGGSGWLGSLAVQLHWLAVHQGTLSLGHRNDVITALGWSAP